MSATGGELALLGALIYEIEDFKASDTKAMWDLEPEEHEAVLKWMNNRMAEIKAKRDLETCN